MIDKFKWVALLCFIIILESIPGDTLTQMHLKALKSVEGKIFIVTSEAFIVSHLWGIVPRHIDPLIYLAKKTGH